MTCKEMLRIEHPSFVGDEFTGECGGCPDTYGYLDIPDYCNDPAWTGEYCARCWDREIPDSEE